MKREGTDSDNEILYFFLIRSLHDCQENGEILYESFLKILLRDTLKFLNFSMIREVNLCATTTSFKTLSR